MAFRTVELTGPAEIHVKNGSLLIEKEVSDSKNMKTGSDKEEKNRVAKDNILQYNININKPKYDIGAFLP